MPCISSSSDEDELTCLLDVVGKGVEGRPETDEQNCKAVAVVVKEEVKVEETPRVMNLVTGQVKNKTEKVGIETIEEEKTNNRDDGLSEMSLVDQVEILKKDICALLVERERMSEKIDDFKTVRGGKEEELRAELFSSYEKLENAKAAAKEQLTRLYRQKQIERGCVKASKEEFYRMKEEYFGKVVEAGQLEEKVRELKHEVREANKNVANLKEEIQKVTGRYQEPQNIWQRGVPYGSTAGRSAGSERDRYGRVVEDRGGDQRVFGKRRDR